MDAEELNKIINSINQKVGDDMQAQIADDLAKIVTANSSTNEIIKNKDTEIATLKTEKQNLITANGNLLQQVSFIPEKKETEKEDQKEPIKFSDIFDAKGNFK